MTSSPSLDTLSADQLRAHLKTLMRACANVAAQHERFKSQDLFVHHVHPSSLKAIAAAYRAIPKLHEQPSISLAQAHAL